MSKAGRKRQRASLDTRTVEERRVQAREIINRARADIAAAIRRMGELDHRSVHSENGQFLGSSATYEYFVGKKHDRVDVYYGDSKNGHVVVLGGRVEYIRTPRELVSTPTFDRDLGDSL